MRSLKIPFLIKDKDIMANFKAVSDWANGVSASVGATSSGVGSDYSGGDGGGSSIDVKSKVPSPPVNFGVDVKTVEVIGAAPASEYTLKWGTPKTNTDGSKLSDISGYEIEWHTGNDFAPLASLGNVNSFLVPGVFYYEQVIFRCATKNSLGVLSDWSVYSVANLDTPDAPDPTGVVLESIESAGVMKVTWDSISRPSAYGVNIQFMASTNDYTVGGTPVFDEWPESTSENTITQPVGANQPAMAQFSAEELTKWYKVRIRWVVSALTDDKKTSEWVESSAVPVGKANVAPIAPTSVAAFPLYRAIAVKWDAPSVDFGTYEVYGSTASNFTPSSANLKAVVTGNSAVVTGLQTGVSFYVKVRAVSWKGEVTAYSATVSAAPAAVVQSTDIFGDIIATSVTTGWIYAGTIGAGQITTGTLAATTAITVGFTGANNKVVIDSSGISGYWGSSTPYFRLQPSGLTIANAGIDVTGAAGYLQVKGSSTSSGSVRIDSLGIRCFTKDGVPTTTIDDTYGVRVTDEFGNEQVRLGYINGTKGSGATYGLKVTGLNNRITGANIETASSGARVVLSGESYASILLYSGSLSESQAGALTTIYSSSAGGMGITRLTSPSISSQDSAIIDLYSESGDGTSPPLLRSTAQILPLGGIRGIACGYATITGISSGVVKTHPVEFPSGRFITTPNVVLCPNTQYPDQVSLSAQNLNSSGFDIKIHRSDSITTCTVYWIAVGDFLS